jgi:hypothetical protein
MKATGKPIAKRNPSFISLSWIVVIVVWMVVIVVLLIVVMMD